MKKISALLCAAALCVSLAACGADDTSTAAAAPSETAAAYEPAAAVETDEMVEYGLDGAAEIVFSQNGAAVSGSGAQADGTVVTITSPGAYRVSGECENGQLWVDVDKTESVTIYMDGLTLRSADGCPLVAQHGLVTLVLMEGTESSLADAADYALTVTSDETAVDGALFAKDSLTIKGEGSLTVTGSYKHGIVCKDILTVAGGTLTVSCEQDGLQAGDGLLISGGGISVSAGDDGMHCDAALEISGGTVDILSSYEGLEGASITVSGGDISVKASDDGLNAAGGEDSSGTSGGFGADAFEADAGKTITISGGTLFVDAEGDGIDSNGSIAVTGGVTLVCGPVSSANGALDYGTTASVSGGVVMAVGSSGMAESFSQDSAQGSIMANVSGEAGKTVALVDANGTALCAFTPTKAYQNIVISCPGIESGAAYTIAAGTVSGGGHGYAENTVITGAVTLASVEMTSLHYSEGGMEEGFGGMGQRPSMPSGGTPPSGGMTPPDAASGATPDA